MPGATIWTRACAKSFSKPVGSVSLYRVLSQVFRRGFLPNVSFRPQKENGHADTMLDLTGRGAEKYVREEAMSVRAHRHQVAAFLLNPLDDFLSRFAVG